MLCPASQHDDVLVSQGPLMPPEPLKILAGDLVRILDVLLQQIPGGEVGPGLGLVQQQPGRVPERGRVDDLLVRGRRLQLQLGDQLLPDTLLGLDGPVLIVPGNVVVGVGFSPPRSVNLPLCLFGPGKR